jgi:hypothetical protein
MRRKNYFCHQDVSVRVEKSQNAKHADNPDNWQTSPSFPFAATQQAWIYWLLL